MLAFSASFLDNVTLTGSDHLLQPPLSFAKLHARILTFLVLPASNPSHTQLLFPVYSILSGPYHFFPSSSASVHSYPLSPSFTSYEYSYFSTFPAFGGVHVRYMLPSITLYERFCGASRLTFFPDGASSTSADVLSTLSEHLAATLNLYVTSSSRFSIVVLVRLCARV